MSAKPGITPAKLDELERRAFRASDAAVAGVCSIDAAELRELVSAYRLCLLMREIVQEARGEKCL